MTLFDFDNTQENKSTAPLSDEQILALKKAGIDFSILKPEEILRISTGDIEAANLSKDRLVEFLTVTNCMYRAGFPLISDADYDHLFLAQLQKQDPEHSFLQEIEPEAVFEGKTIELPAPMLSTEKSHSMAELKKWIVRIQKAAKEIGKDFSALIFRVTPKLDGYAGYDDGVTGYTRGDGKRGTDITRVFDRGLQIAQNGKRGLGPGEIVVSQSYFDSVLACTFEHARNVQSSLIKEGELHPLLKRAIHEGAAVFYPFSLLPNWEGKWADLVGSFDEISLSLKASVDFGLDGLVLEVVDEELKAHMGSTRKFHRWQIAFKQNTEMAQTTVLDVIPQTGRTGQVTPVIRIKPVKLSGALLQRATAHHYGAVKDKGIGVDSIVEICRSGEVIPKIERVITPTHPLIPAACPSCSSDLYWDDDFLKCPNTAGCRGQIVNTIFHFFKTLGNVDGFGPATIEQLFEHGVRSVVDVYRLSAGEFESMGLGPKQSQNLVDQLRRSRLEQIEDWRFLAAFGVSRLGRGSSENLLESFPLEQVISLTREEIAALKGFGETTANSIVTGLEKIFPDFKELFSLGFNLELTPLVGASDEDSAASPFAGKQLVFTGSMQHGSRGAMKKEAKSFGAKVGSSISGKTDFLITGKNVGATKMNAAVEKGVKVLSEEEYLAMLGKI